MPHFEEMPSFLNDDTGGSMYSSSSRPPLDLPSHLRNSHEKLSVNGANAVNGINGRTSTHNSIRNGLENGSDAYIDGGAASNGHANGYSNTHSNGNGSAGRHHMNGDSHHEPTLNSLPNGRSSAGSWDYRSRSSMNGSTYSVNEQPNASSQNGRRSPGPANGFNRLSNGAGDRNSFASTNGTISNATVDSPRPITTSDSEHQNRFSNPQPLPNPHSTGPLTYQSPLLPSTPVPTNNSLPIPETPGRSTSTSPQPQLQPQPQRFSSLSSPPTYPPPSSPSQNSLQHPGSTQLKHRHTLEVPKVGSGRNSRDGNDAVFTSGRFSPTSVATAGARRGSSSINRRNTQSIHSNMPHEEVPPDEDALRWAEAVRQKRASKRRKKDEEDDDRVVVGTKVDQNHVNWVTAYNMLTGIRFTVSRTNAKLDRPLTDADFEAKHKFSFDITGNELTPSAKYDFKFKDYAPWVFRSLRARFKLDPADYLMSLTSKYILSELGSPGKSGSFFYFSRDYKYIIKTIHHSEHKFLRKILKDYYHHVEDNPNTLLSQFYGLHRVKIPYGRKIHFVVMNNLFPPHRDVHQTFDLKGSTIGRDFKEENLEQNPRATLKDLNWLRRNLHLEFGPEKRRVFFEQMEKDVALLQKLKIMDYSMLVGIHDLTKGNEENLRDKTLQVFQPGGDSPVDDSGPPGPLMRTPSKLESARKARELRQIIKQEKPIPMGQSSSRMPDEIEEENKKDFTFYSDDGGFRATHEDNSPGEEIFFLSIIDCLTHYGTLKKLEHLFKGLKHDKKMISPINPQPYGDRFVEFIEGITKSKEEAAREEECPLPPVPHTDSNLTMGSTRRRSNSAHVHRTVTNNTTIQRAENEALRTEHEGRREHIEPRTVSTIRSPSAERTNGLQGQILPVVEEMGEASSTGGRSGRSIRSTHDDDDERRPATPAKDYPPSLNENQGRPQSLRRMISRSSLEKQLPPLPPNGRAVEEKDSGIGIGR
ncbi:Bcmss4 [Botrytis cinerea B05.10]|uniref:1-phosphatidylinositol-4-phosphate 5-kinase n=2 Tax=Botryotinia fuckeliana TaxID=40559 RepID=A0A384J9Q9_BOTFB|nr:Bcmss4 [Botrytis cinerea B05.10]ATZ47182.1 Bcmss4 [Botrytis cinerea B05.10]EMR86620.1 putative phosphatidylinositol-4-phosphate 5-kinase its3 protein [Botrytis cinerea BcDW1]